MALVARPTLLQQLMTLPPATRADVIASLKPEVARALRYAWREVWARSPQLAPGSLGAAPAMRGRLGLTKSLRDRQPPNLEFSDDWTFWLLKPGRGFGKSRTGAEWVIERARSQPGSHGALIAATGDDARKSMLSAGLEHQPDAPGILAHSPPGFRPRFEMSKGFGRLTWPNGTVADIYSAEKPSRLRGPAHHWGWVDEMAAWGKHQEAWEQFLYGLRLGDKPQAVITTTPRPLPILRNLLHNPRCMITHGSSYENRANLAAEYFRSVIEPAEGTRMGRQEIHGDLLDDIEGALWNLAMFEPPCRVSSLAALGIEQLERVVVSIDPQASEGTGDTDHPEGPETGIVVVGRAECRCKGDDKSEVHGFVLEDLSGNFSPNDWATRGVQAYEHHRADRIIGEKNNGGAMVEATIRTVDRNVSYSAVWASRGKRTRAEPIAALYEQNKIHHVGRAEPLAHLEDQLTTWDGTGASPNRLDALVHGLTDLLLVGEESTAENLMRVKW